MQRPWRPQDLIDDLQLLIDEEPDSYLNDRRTTLCMARDFLKEHFAEPRWISVEERLPENKSHDWVLAQVVEDNGYVHIPKVMEYRQNRNDWFEETYGWISEHNGAFTVTHWMPMPELPEVEA